MAAKPSGINRVIVNLTTALLHTIFAVQNNSFSRTLGCIFETSAELGIIIANVESIIHEHLQYFKIEETFQLYISSPG